MLHQIEKQGNKCAKTSRRNTECQETSSDFIHLEDCYFSWILPRLMYHHPKLAFANVKGQILELRQLTPAEDLSDNFSYAKNHYIENRNS